MCVWGGGRGEWGRGGVLFGQKTATAGQVGSGPLEGGSGLCVCVCVCVCVCGGGGGVYVCVCVCMCVCVFGQKTATAGQVGLGPLEGGSGLCVCVCGGGGGGCCLVRKHQGLARSALDRWKVGLGCVCVCGGVVWSGNSRGWPGRPWTAGRWVWAVCVCVCVGGGGGVLFGQETATAGQVGSGPLEGGSGLCLCVCVGGGGSVVWSINSSSWPGRPWTALGWVWAVCVCVGGGGG